MYGAPKTYLFRFLARRSGKTLSAILEDGLRRVLDASSERSRYELPDRSRGKVGAPNPLERFSWQDLRDESCGGR